MKCYNGFDPKNIDKSRDIVVIVDKYPVVCRFDESGDLIRYGIGDKIEMADVNYVSYNDFDLSLTVSQERILERAIELSLADVPEGEKPHTIHSNYCDWVEYQRAAFEYFYPGDSNDFKHVNFFRPSSCYYPVGWYNLGGEQSQVSDEIGHKIDDLWSVWRLSLYRNKLLQSIVSNHVSYECF